MVFVAARLAEQKFPQCLGGANVLRKIGSVKYKFYASSENIYGLGQFLSSLAKSFGLCSNHLEKVGFFVEALDDQYISLRGGRKLQNRLNSTFISSVG